MNHCRSRSLIRRYGYRNPNPTCLQMSNRCKGKPPARARHLVGNVLRALNRLHEGLPFLSFAGRAAKDLVELHSRLRVLSAFLNILSLHRFKGTPMQCTIDALALLGSLTHLCAMRKCWANTSRGVTGRPSLVHQIHLCGSWALALIPICWL